MPQQSKQPGPVLADLFRLAGLYKPMLPCPVVNMDPVTQNKVVACKSRHGRVQTTVCTSNNNTRVGMESPTELRSPWTPRCASGTNAGKTKEGNPSLSSTAARE
ncbi:unnamed protein product [Arctogadus glacialis]